MVVLCLNLNLDLNFIISCKFPIALVLSGATLVGGCCLSTYTPFVQKRMQELISEASYLAVTCDETTAVDNSSWLSLHIYVMENWG